jgi:hypothetical protein
VLWIMRLPSAAGFASFFRSSIYLSALLHLSTVTMCPLSTCLPIGYNIDEPSTSRLIFILFERRLHWEKFKFFMCPLLSSSPMS